MVYARNYYVQFNDFEEQEKSEVLVSPILVKRTTPINNYFSSKQNINCIYKYAVKTTAHTYFFECYKKFKNIKFYKKHYKR